MENINISPQNLQEIDRAGYGMIRGNDDLLIVKFYKKSVPNPRKSKDAGRPMYDAVDYVFIQQPGERDNTDRPAHEGDMQRFPRQWFQYSKNVEQVPEGTPLNQLFLDPNEVNVPPYLNGLGIYTVEQLECLSATAIQNIGLGGTEWVNKAKAFIDYARKGKGFHHLDRDNKALNNKLQVAEQQIAAMKALLDQLMAERHGLTNFPNRRPQSHASIAQRQFQVPESSPQSEDAYPDPGTPLPDIVLGDDGLKAEQKIPVFADPESSPDTRRRGRPPGSKNNPAASE